MRDRLNTGEGGNALSNLARGAPVIRDVRRRLIVAALSAVPLLFLLGIAKAERDDHAPEPPVIEGLDHAH